MYLTKTMTTAAVAASLLAAIATAGCDSLSAQRPAAHRYVVTVSGMT
jgi:hypothetical protein